MMFDFFFLFVFLSFCSYFPFSFLSRHVQAFSSVPYEKGFNFLFYLEGIVGTEEFEKFQRNYIEKFKFSTVTSEEFKEFFCSQFQNKANLSQIEWDHWFNEPGMPLVTPKFDTTLANESTALAEK
jgi:leukotriene-A4 hydrolase